MKKWLLLLLCAGLIASSFPASASASTASPEVPAVIEVVKSVNFRTGPSTGEPRIRFLKKGETLDVLSRPNNYWYEAKDRNGVTGYVSTSSTYVKVIQTESVPEPNGVIVRSVNFRTKPSTSGERIRFLQKGEHIWILEKANAYWYKARDAYGEIGYVSTSSKYIDSTFETAPEREDEAYVGDANGVVVASVNFRTKPSTSGKRIRFLQKGEYILILEKVNAYWYKAKDAYGEVGYVSTSSKYIDSMYEAELEPEEETFFGDANGVVVASVNFRTKPSTSGERIRFLRKGEPLWVLNRHNAYWYQVMDKNGVTGFVSTSAKYVETTYQEPWKRLSRAELAEQAIATGLTLLGTPYEFGSNRHDPATFDCSDFVRHTFLSSVQLTLPGDSRKQAEFVRNLHDGQVKMDWRELERGDLMFFMGYKGYKPSAYAGIDRMRETVRHVGIYLGDGQVLHTYSANSGGVRIDHVADSQWELRFLYGGSPVK